MPFDTFANNADSPSSPARNCFAVIPDDSTELESVTKAIYVGAGGDVALRAVESDSDVIFRNVPAGSILDVRTALRQLALMPEARPCSPC